MRPAVRSTCRTPPAPTCGQYGPRAARRQILERLSRAPDHVRIPQRCRAAPSQLIEQLGIQIWIPSCIRLALTHRSYRVRERRPAAQRAPGIPGRLGAGRRRHRASSTCTYPDLPEGRLAKLRAAVVNAHSLADVARAPSTWAMPDPPRQGRAHHRRCTTSPRSSPTRFEALLGAVLISAGRDGADLLIHHPFRSAGRARPQSWAPASTGRPACRSTAANNEPRRPQSYRVTETGPDHDKRFAAVAIDRQPRRTRPERRHVEEAGRAAARRRTRSRPCRRG